MAHGDDRATAQLVQQTGEIGGERAWLETGVRNA
jgi:hypothetical protein